jgi:uncharacterized GH25 family protein
MKGVPEANMKSFLTSLAALTAALISMDAHGARAWLLPSQTILANSGGWIAVDAAQADDLFSANQGALGIDALIVTGPDGKPVAPQNAIKSWTRSSFDLELRTAGTYRVSVVEDAVTARWEEDGKPKRWRGNAADMAAGIPANASGLEVEQMQRRVETFVSVGALSTLATAGTGLELVPLRHPNDLYAGESARFRFLLDGKPAPDLRIDIIAGGTRYRDAPGGIQLKTDANGEVAVRWPAAGLYWLDAGVHDERASVPNVKRRRAGYNATFEVLTQ